MAMIYGKVGISDCKKLEGFETAAEFRLVFVYFDNI